MFGSRSIVSADVERKEVTLFASEKATQVAEAVFLIVDLCRWESAVSNPAFIHGGAVQIGASGVLLVAPPRHGKSILSLALLAHPNTRWIGDNNVSLDRSAGGQILGWPTPAAIRRSSLGIISTLSPKFQGFLERDWHQGINIARDDTVPIWPHELRALGIPTTSSAIPSVLFFPELRSDPDESASCERLKLDAAACLLDAHWDVLPERRPGALASEARAGRAAWSDITFHQFTLAAFASYIPLLRDATPSWLVERVPAYRIAFGERRLIQAANLVRAALEIA